MHVRALVALVLLVAAPALAQTPAEECDPASHTSAPRTIVRKGNVFRACSSASELPLLWCEWRVRGVPVRIEAPVAQALYDVAVPVAGKRGDVVPLEAECANEDGVSEVSIGELRFPAPPSSPVLVR